MFRFFRKPILLTLVFLLLVQSAAWAAAKISSIRHSSDNDRDRIVFDLDQMPAYTVRAEHNGKRIILDFADVSKPASKLIPKISGDRIRSIQYKYEKKHLLVTIQLASGTAYKVDQLENPARIVFDVSPQKASDPAPKKPSSTVRKSGTSEVKLAPGLILKTYLRQTEGDRLAAYFLFADRNRYDLRPALAQGKIPGRGTVSRIVRDTGALAGVNASYFVPNGEMIGITKIDGVMAGTTYFYRSAIGILEDGRPAFGKVDYNGQVTLGGVTLPVSAVNAERGEDNLVLYNRWYGNRTNTNEYGLEFVVENGQVTAINTADSKIPYDGVVVSVHGASMAPFSQVRVGDPAEIVEDMGDPWNDALQIIGAGPRLVENGRVHVTVAEEEFPGDIRYGRAPRTAVGVTKNGDYLLAVVDGRQAISHGCTLTEWAELLRDFGAVDAINLDGGGSSEMVADGDIVNSPSDGSERPVGSALVITKKKKK